MTEDRTYPLLAAIGALFICLLVCIGLIATSAFSKDNVQAQLEIYEQNYTRDLGTIERNYEIKLNRLQEQINSNEFVSRRRIELLEDDIRRSKLELQTLMEKTKARNQ